MKKILIVIFCCFAFSANAQSEKDTLRINAGFTLAPQAGLVLKEPKSGFTTFMGLHLTVAITKKDITFIPSYFLSDNALGMVIEYEVTPKLATYVVGSKKLLSRSVYTALGFERPVAQGKAAAFIEVGSDWEEFEPCLFTGVFIPLSWVIK